MWTAAGLTITTKQVFLSRGTLKWQDMNTFSLSVHSSAPSKESRSVVVFFVCVHIKSSQMFQNRPLNENKNLWMCVTRRLRSVLFAFPSSWEHLIKCVKSKHHRTSTTSGERNIPSVYSHERDPSGLTNKQRKRRDNMKTIWNQSRAAGWLRRSIMIISSLTSFLNRWGVMNENKLRSGIMHLFCHASALILFCARLSSRRERCLFLGRLALRICHRSVSFAKNTQWTFSAAVNTTRRDFIGILLEADAPLGKFLSHVSTGTNTSLLHLAPPWAKFGSSRCCLPPSIDFAYICAPPQK